MNWTYPAVGTTLPSANVNLWKPSSSQIGSPNAVTMASETKLPVAPKSSSLFTGTFTLKWTTLICILKNEQLTLSPCQVAHLDGDFCYVTPPLLLWVLCCHSGQPMTEMGGRHPSPALHCPPNPSLGLAVFCTSHSIGLVLPIAQAET